MDHEAVIEFLGQVPLLQRLPSSSIVKIAELVQVKHYETGEYVVQEGEVVNGIYFISEGQAEVLGSNNTDERNRPDLVLKQFDYFGYGGDDSVNQVDVVAISKLTCLVLRPGDQNLLRPKSIWNADGNPEDLSLVERILHLEPLEVDIFRGFNLPGSPSFRQVFGGQFIGQALAAASHTVDCLKRVHSLHAYFIVAGDKNWPTVYEVHRVRDGKSFATRTVDAKQNGIVVFTLMASFKKDETGFEHQNVLMPQVPAPETLLSLEELRERRIMDPRLPIEYRNTVARKKFVPWPIEMKLCESPLNSRNSLLYWFKTRGKLSNDQGLHSCVVAYASDLYFLDAAVDPHRRKGFKTTSLSLDHSMWFHRPVKADDWLLNVIDSSSAYGGRGFVSSHIFNRNGELVISVTQEGVVRKLKQSSPHPKL